MDVLSKNAFRPSRCRELVTDLMQRFGASQRQTCVLLNLSRTVYRYKSVARDQTALEMRIKEITEVRVRYGALCVYVMLRGEGWRDNHKRVRVYRELGLSSRQGSRRPANPRISRAMG